MESINENALNVLSKITSDTVLMFDMDGTLINTNHANFLSYKKAIELVTESQWHLAFDQNQRFNRSNLKNIIPNLSKTDYSRIIEEKEKCYDDFLSHTKINAEIADILFKYSKTNKTVLVTNCRKERAAQTIAHHALTEKFNHLFFRQFNSNDSKVNKFQYAIQSLGISPDQVVVFENETIEIQDAIEAGINNYYLVQP